jgi:hypothetical protein
MFAMVGYNRIDKKTKNVKIMLDGMVEDIYIRFTLLLDLNKRHGFDK